MTPKKIPMKRQLPPKSAMRSDILSPKVRVLSNSVAMFWDSVSCWIMLSSTSRSREDSSPFSASIIDWI